MSDAMYLQYKGVKVPTIITDRRLQCVYFNPACVAYPEIRMQADFLTRCLSKETVEQMSVALDEKRMTSFTVSLGSRGYVFHIVLRPGDEGAEIMLFPTPAAEEPKEEKALRDSYAAGYRHLLSHELFSMMNALQLAQTEGISETQRQQQYDIVRRNVMRSIRTASHMNELLSQNEPAFMVIDYVAFLRDIIDVANVYLLKTGWRTVELLLPEEAVAVRADPIMLQCMIYNLLSNALRFSEKGTRILVQLRKNETFSVLSVLNDGICSFETVLSVGRSQSGNLGTGAGLALVRKLIKMHQGQFMLHNTEDHKTAATLLLPLADTEPVLHELVREIMDTDLSVVETELSDLPMMN